MVSFKIRSSNIMDRFTKEELLQRGFERAAWVLRHFW